MNHQFLVFPEGAIEAMDEQIARNILRASRNAAIEVKEDSWAESEMADRMESISEI